MLGAEIVCTRKVNILLC